MSLSFLSPSRTVLLIGDDALSVYSVTSRTSKLIDTVPWQTDGFEDVVSDYIRKQCGGKSVLVLNDMTDQHFKGGQRLPKAGFADKSSILKRKLQVAFPNYQIRGALPVKEDKSKKKPAQGAAKTIKGGGGLYLFAAVPVSEPVVKTMAAVRQSMASVAGFVLLPVEASDMVLELSKKAAGKESVPARWVIFMGQHQSGALRQVIIRDGQLAMTRMTPVADPHAEASAWAQEVHQEFKATISYLSRFGFEPTDGVDVFVVADRDGGDALESLIDVPCHYRALSSSEAASMLGMRIGLQEDPRYADPLHVAWAGRKAKFILPMEAREISQIHGPRQAVAAVVALLVLGGGYLSWSLFSHMGTVFETQDELSRQRAVLVQAQAERDEEVERMRSLGFDIALIQGTIGVYESFEADRIHALRVIKHIGDSLGPEMRLDSMTMEKRAPQRGSAALRQGEAAPEPPAAQVNAVLSLSFSPGIRLEDGIRDVNGLSRRLQAALPAYDVTIARQVARPEYTQDARGVAGSGASRGAAADDYTAEIIIRGPNR